MFTIVPVQVSYNLSALNSKGSLAFLIATWFNPLNARLLFFWVSVSISVRDDKECTKLFPNSITLTAHFFSHVCAVQGQTYAAGLMAPLCLCLSHICLWALMSFLCLVKMWLGSLQQISVLFCFVFLCLIMMMGIYVHPQCMQAKVPSPQTLPKCTQTQSLCVLTQMTKKEVGPLYGSLESIMQQPVSVQARGSPVTRRCMPPFPPAGI